MLSVSVSLDNAIESWCGLKPIEYSPTAALSTLWARSGSPSSYDSVGILALIQNVRAQPTFQTCHQATSLTAGMFGAGGGLQNKSQLFQHLENCPS